MTVILWPLIAWWAWDQPVTVVVGTTGKGHLLGSDRLVGVGSDSHCGGGIDR
jgi:hypothetical protein